MVIRIVRFFRNSHFYLGTGTPNRITTMQREFIQKILDNQTERFEVELSRLKGLDYLKTSLALFGFVMPKLSRAEISNTTPIEKTSIILPNGRIVEI